MKQAKQTKKASTQKPAVKAETTLLNEAPGIDDVPTEVVPLFRPHVSVVRDDDL